jgi:glycosidase
MWGWPFFIFKKGATKMITKTAIYHRGRGSFAYGYDKDTVQIRIRLAKHEATAVELRIGDGYDWANGGGGGNLNASGAMGWVGGKSIPMTKEVETELHEYWVANFSNATKRFRYAFIIEGLGERILYGEKRIVDLNEDNELATTQELGNFFGVPYLNAIDVASTPSWVRDTIWYQIFPERFANGDDSLTPADAVPWGSTPTTSCMMGGDLVGVINKLDYLKDLGITGIYFCPIFKAKSNHKYDTIDYMEIDPQFGDKEVFRKLVNEAHARGIRIMLDAVFNHAGRYSPMFQDVLKNQEKSKYKDWFYLKSFPVSAEERNYETFGFTPEMPKFNTENPDCKAYLLNVGEYWVREFGIDGWRIDVANEVDFVFWREFRQRVKAINPECYILGEIWFDSMPWLNGDQFDAVMDYPVCEAINDFVCHGKLNAEQFKYAINDGLVRYPKQINEVTFTLLDSHDTARVVNAAGGNLELTKLAYLLLFSYTGSPNIYYGGEIGLDGGPDPDCRKAMPWDRAEVETPFSTFIRKLIQLRKTVPALRTTTYEWIKADKRSPVVVFRKISEAGSVLIVMNVSGQKQSFNWNNKKRRLQDLISDKKITLDGEVKLKPYQAYILEE